MRKKFIVLFSVLSLYGTDTTCQIARQTSLGGIMTVNEGIYASSGNPADLSWKDHSAFYINYEKHIFISPLDQQFVCFSRSNNNKAISLSIHHTGDNRLQKNKFSLQYGQAFSKKFSLGLRINSEQISFSDNYGSSIFFHADFGFSLKLNEQIKLGFLITNLGRSMVVSDYNERLPSEIISGLVYHLSEISALYIELEKKSQSHLNAKIGVEYKPHSDFSLRCGFQSLNRLFSAGFGLGKKSIDIDTSIKYNRSLGYSISLGLIIKIRKTEIS